MQLDLAMVGPLWECSIVAYTKKGGKGRNGDFAFVWEERWMADSAVGKEGWLRRAVAADGGGMGE